MLLLHGTADVASPVAAALVAVAAATTNAALIALRYCLPLFNVVSTVSGGVFLAQATGRQPPPRLVQRPSPRESKGGTRTAANSAFPVVWGDSKVEFTGIIP